MHDKASQTPEIYRALRTLKDLPRVGVAYSGGLDSTVLLHSLWTMRGPDGLFALHVCHHLRPEPELLEEQRHLLAVCMGLGVPLFIHHLGPSELEAGIQDHGVEGAARALRYEALEEWARALNLSTLVLAHHEDDQVETVFMAFVRGGGLGALSGIPRTRGIFCRPFLDLPRSYLEAYGKEHGLSFSQDSSNTELVYGRNRVRHLVLPTLEPLVPNLRSTLVRARRRYERINAYLEGETEAILTKVMGQGSPSKHKTLSLPGHTWDSLAPALRERVVLTMTSTLLRAHNLPFKRLPWRLIDELVDKGTDQALSLEWNGLTLELGSMGLAVRFAIVGQVKNSYLLPSPGDDYMDLGDLPWYLSRDFRPDLGPGVFIPGLDFPLVMRVKGPPLVWILGSQMVWVTVRTQGNQLPQVLEFVIPRGKIPSGGLWMFGKGSKR